MSIDLSGVKLGIKTDFDAIGNEEIIQNVGVIISTRVGEVVSDRAFGIDYTILDRPILLSKGLLIQEYTRKIRQYEPRAEVVSVTFEQDPVSGLLIPKVVITIVSS